MLDPIYTEGICGDGAMILKDGDPVTISDVLAALNEGELRKMALETIAIRLEPRIDAAEEAGKDSVGIGIPLARQIIAAIRADLLFMVIQEGDRG